jgi:hypothetical protein
MKTNCIGVAELLCAYADGELEKSKIHIVEDHLLICENCSAILKLYGEISSAIEETNVPAPEILRPGVMNRIQCEEIFTDAEKTKKRRQYHFVLTRFAPVAACLIVGLLIWQPWGESFNISGSDQAAMPATQGDSEPYTMMTSVPAPESGDYETLPDEMLTDDDTDMAGEPAGGNYPWDDFFEADGTFRQILPDRDNELLQEHINGAYAEIAITGELPVLLKSYLPQAFGPWLEWDMVFEIPLTEMTALLDELGNNEESEITRNTQNVSSPYVMVFFSFER